MTPTRTYRFCACALFAAAFTPLAAGAQSAPAYTVTNVVNLGAPERWDYLTFDAQAKRIYVSHGTEVTVVDGVSGKIIGNVDNLPGSHGIAIASTLKRGAADSAKNQQVTFFDSETLKPLGNTRAGQDADGMAYDAKTHRAFIANGDASTVTAVDMASGQFVATVPLGAKPEFLVTDGNGQVFVNMESTKEIVRVDAAKLTVAARFPIADCESPHGIAMDVATRRLFTSCENSRLMVVDADSGRIVATLAIGKYTDAAAFDPSHKRVFSSNGEGTLSVIAEKSADDFEALGNVPTFPGARTMTVDPDTGRVFLVTADIDHIDPPKEAGGRPHPVYKPGSAKLYFLDPAH